MVILPQTLDIVFSHPSCDSFLAFAYSEEENKGFRITESQMFIYMTKKFVACVAVFSVSFQAGGRRARARDRGDKKLVRSRDFPLTLAFYRQEETEKTATQAKKFAAEK